MSEELKPCPFCGGKAEVKRISGDYGYTPNSVSVGCAACAISFSDKTEEWKPGLGTYSVYDLAVGRITRRWNTRIEVRND